MDWRKTKTIFILTFLVLNIYLGVQILEKREQSQLELLAEASTEEKFEVDEITYADLPKAPPKESYISGSSYVFTDDDLEKLMEDKGQEVRRVDETTINAVWKEPIALPETNMTSRLNTVFQDQILFADQYKFWGYNQVTNTLYFFQQYDGKHIYSNSSGMVMVQLNELNQIISYVQTYITDLQEMDVEQDVISVFNALENLYNSGDLRPRSHVGHMELGYYTLLDNTNSHVLIPTWHIVIDEDQDYFVNAFEGSIIKKDNRTLE
ncbi:two-component system regulatory protein YycI [Sutcliffiella horikoshii]|uniref:two-component system regulatory protein YycI n=1 Tax=Sutcliffiella horikoshii TaxID=79883 RepID=UPI00203F8736|nr:two-component system regulatory protein YycI [Sutcliffiella horikoshii]MCM3618211.1 two-component system regulatory protein YycI [Sutcliffiella horikoshii]